MLIPALAVKYVLGRSRFHGLAILTLIPGLIYFLYIYLFIPLKGVRVSFGILDSLILIFGRQFVAQVISPEMGEKFVLMAKDAMVWDLSSMGWSLIAAVFLFFFIYVTVATRIRAAKWLFVAFVLYLLPGVLAPIADHKLWPTVVPLYGDRYALASGVLQGLILLTIARHESRANLRRVSMFLLIWFLTIRAVDFYPPDPAKVPNSLVDVPITTFPYHTGPNWPQQVEQFRSGATDYVRVWPRWKLTINRCVLDATCPSLSNK